MSARPLFADTDFRFTQFGGCDCGDGKAVCDCGMGYAQCPAPQACGQPEPDPPSRVMRWLDEVAAGDVSGALIAASFVGALLLLFVAAPTLREVFR